jgi:hypothetical protein
MNLRDYGNRTSILLRVAPWADLELIREKFAEHLLKICEQPDYFTEAQKEVIREFSKGERHIVPATIRGNRAIERTLSQLYPAQRDYDAKFEASRREFVNYFTRTDSSLRLQS